MSNVHSWKSMPNQLQHWRQLKGAIYLQAYIAFTQTTSTYRYFS